jgi:CheY-like chemotaxis protein
MIDQVLMNLAINARDAMPRGGELIIETTAQTIEAASELGAELEAGDHACINVVDTGVGIPAEVLPRIFEPFFTTKEVGKGTGLGLATVFGIVKQHRGAVRVCSEAGRGTTFRVLLPLSREAVRSPAAELRSAPLRGRGETVLLIEDDVAVQRITKHSLEQAGYRVVAATNGPAAIHAWKRLEGKVDLLLSDLVLPGGATGDELALRFRASRPDLPVILMSGYSAKGIDHALSSADRLVFVQKPFEVVSLLTHVQQLLRARA